MEHSFGKDAFIFKFDRSKCLRIIWQLHSEEQQQQQGDIIHRLPQMNPVREGGQRVFPTCWRSLVVFRLTQGKIV